MRSDAFSPKQKQFFINATHRWNIKTGATRSGKTYMDYFVIPKRIMATKGNGLIVLLGNTQQTLTRNILDPMRNIWGPGLVGSIRANTGSVVLFGKKCYALGADNVSRVDAIQGASIEYCYGDEVTTWSQNMFEMLKSRLDKPNSCFDGTCNPDSPLHWLKKFLDSDADIYQQKYTIDDNPFLSPVFVENLKREYMGTVYYDRFINGDWTLAQGLVYSIFRKDRNVYEELPDGVADRAIRYVSIDYGTANPCCFLEIYYDREQQMVYVEREYYYDGRAQIQQNTDNEYAQELLSFLPPDRCPGGLVIDPSALSFRVTVKKMGYRVTEADNDVSNGIRDVSSLMSLGKLKVNARRCPNLMEELGTYAWDEKAAIATGKERPIKTKDHACDALRYFVRTKYKMRSIQR